MKPQMIVIAILIGFLGGGCNNSQSLRSRLIDHLNQVDKIQISCYQHNDTIVRTFSDIPTIQIYNELIKSAPVKIDIGSHMGQVKYFTGTSLLCSLIVTTTGCEYKIQQKNYRIKLTYRAGRFFDETCANMDQLKK